jgi:hypothetical protein
MQEWKRDKSHVIISTRLPLLASNLGNATTKISQARNLELSHHERQYRQFLRQPLPRSQTTVKMAGGISVRDVDVSMRNYAR